LNCIFTARCTIVQSAVSQLHVVWLSVGLLCWSIRTTQVGNLGN